MDKPKMSELADKFLAEQLDRVKSGITAEAEKLAAAREEREIAARDIADVYKRFAPGTEISEVSVAAPAEKLTLSDRIFAIPPILIVSSLLAIIFGVIGYKGGAGALDIAKLLVGAIVGSTGTVMLPSAKRK